MESPGAKESMRSPPVSNLQLGRFVYFGNEANNSGTNNFDLQHISASVCPLC